MASDAAPSLAELRDIHLPPPPSGVDVSVLDAGGGFPPAALLTVLALLGVLVAAGVWHAWRQRYRRKALAKVAQLELAWQRHGDGAALAAGVSAVVRGFARRADRNAAGLSGAAWLAYLDARCPEAEIAERGGRGLVDWPFHRSPLVVDAGQVSDFLAAVRVWLRRAPEGAAPWWRRP